MATLTDITTAINSALVEIGVAGQLDVRMDGSRSTTWMGAPTGDDLEVVVRVGSLQDVRTNVAEGHHKHT